MPQITDIKPNMTSARRVMTGGLPAPSQPARVSVGGSIASSRSNGTATAKVVASVSGRSGDSTSSSPSRRPNVMSLSLSNSTPGCSAEKPVGTRFSFSPPSWPNVAAKSGLPEHALDLPVFAVDIFRHAASRAGSGCHMPPPANISPG